MLHGNIHCFQGSTIGVLFYKQFLSKGPPPYIFLPFKCLTSGHKKSPTSLKSYSLCEVFSVLGVFGGATHFKLSTRVARNYCKLLIKEPHLTDNAFNTHTQQFINGLP